MATVGLLAKGWRRTAGAMLVLAAFAWTGAIHSQSPQPREAKVQLSWQPGWTPSGIAVEAGDTLSIRVRTIKGAAEPQPRCQPNPATGYRTDCPQPERQQGTLPEAILNFASRQVILGRLGEGTPFAVGRNFKKVMNAGGALSLRWEVPREAARAAAQGFNVVIRVEPGASKGDGDDGNDGIPILTHGGGNEGSPVNGVDTNDGSPTNNVGDVIDDGPAAEATNLQGNVQEPEENAAAAVDPVLLAPPEDKAVVDPDKNVSAADPETRLSMAQIAVIAAALAAALLALAAAGVGM
ncbi:MAG: hypothetical protein QOJ27_1105, partial [Sphingomonadales bacterium]|nr:hypothetical protein [Sphingomonadales bacterium]